MTVFTDESQARAALVRVVREGNAPNGIQPADCGPWAHVVQSIYDAHASGGTNAARDVWTAITAKDKGLAALLAGEATAQTDDQPDPWEAPLPLGRATEALPLFPTEALPAWLRAYVEALATATQTPADMAATLALAVLATTCQRRIRVSVRPGWAEPTNLYALVAMPPANRKSAVFQALVKPIEAYEAAESARMTPIRGEAKSDLEILEVRLKELQRDGAKRGDEATIAKQAARELAAEIEQFRVPALPRLIVGDVTPEKLASLICEQGGRMALLDAEGGFFDILAGRYSSGQPNLDAVLKGHAGDTLRVDRGTRPSEFVELPALTLGLAVQPAVLDGLAATASFRGKGLLGRFLYSLPTSPVGARTFDAPAVPAQVDAAYQRQMTALLARPTGQDDNGAALPDTLQLTPAALSALRVLHNWLEPQLSEGAELGSLTDWAGKLLGTVARIAGLVHMADHGPEGVHQPISGPTMAAAVQMGLYYLAHAQAAFGLIGADVGVELARKVWRAIAQRGVRTITKREVHRFGIGGVKTVDDLDAPLGLLVRHGYLRAAPVAPAGGRGRKPSLVYEVNPLPSDRIDTIDRNTTSTAFAPVDAANSVNSVNCVSSPRTFTAPVSPEVMAFAHAQLAQADALKARLAEAAAAEEVDY